MPLVPAAIENKLKSEIKDNLKAAFSSETGKGQSYDSTANSMQEKLAAAIAKAVAKVIVEEITQNAQVMPGISSVGVGGGIPGPVTTTTVSPGKIV
jgi:predicted NBD/HSP70 family sugar kinase